MADPKVPPHDDVAEQSVLGAILIDKDAMIDVAEFLRPQHFYKEAHGLFMTPSCLCMRRMSPSMWCR
jgi:replicative DNA helicase